MTTPFSWMMLGAALCVGCASQPATSADSTATTPDLQAGAQGRRGAAVQVQLSQTAITRPAAVGVTAAVPAGTARVVFLRDGVPAGEDTTAPFQTQAVFAVQDSAPHALTARAYAADGRALGTGQATLNVNIGRVLYVSPTGSDSNPGTTPAAPLATLQAALNRTRPGDTVLAGDGTYTNPETFGDVATIRTSGTADAWIALMAYPGQHPRLKSANWAGVKVDGASYVLVQGLTIEGSADTVTLAEALAAQEDLNNPRTSGNGIIVSERYGQPDVRPHHVTIRGNTVSGCPGGGIATSHADWVTIEDNVVRDNAAYAPYANSGISTYQNWNSDGTAGTKMVIRRNVVSGNRNLVPFYASSPDPAQRVITDGNGIIVDDLRNTQNGSALGVYQGRTRVENNVVYGNGGRGIHVYSSDHVDVVHNTTFQNSFQAATPDGELTAFDAGDVTFVNNVSVARPDRPVVKRSSTDPDERATQVFRRNLLSGGTGADVDATQNLVGRDPLLTNPAGGDFRPTAQSPAIDAGATGTSVTQDILGRARPQGAGPDIGAYEVR